MDRDPAAVPPEGRKQMSITAKLSFPSGVSGGQSLSSVLVTWPSAGSSTAKVVVSRAIRACIPPSVITEAFSLVSDADAKWRTAMRAVYETMAPVRRMDFPPVPSLEAPCLDNANSSAHTHVLVIRDMEHDKDVGCILWNSAWCASAATMFIPSAQSSVEALRDFLSEMQHSLSK
jgi:hypothetical protein